MKKSTSKEPFLPLFFGDFLGATAEWDGEERSLYLLALGYQWTLGSLPADLRRLRKLLDYQQSTFDLYWPSVAQKFEVQGDRLLNVRLEQHREKTQQLSDKNSESGKRGAAARWRKDGERHDDGMANATDCDGERHEIANSKRYGATDGNPSHPIPSHPDPSHNHLDTSPLSQTPVAPASQSSATTKAAKVKPAEPEPPEFAEIRKAYPRRAGGQRWGDAVRFYRRRIAEGVTHDAILAGVKRYAEFLQATGKAGTETVQQAATFLGENRGYLEPWAAPPAPPRPLSVVERVAQANGAKRDERVVSEQRAGSSFDDLDLLGADVRQPVHSGIRRLGS